jgi:hypothetical protein
MGAAWILLGNLAVAHGSRMDPSESPFSQVRLHSPPGSRGVARDGAVRGGTVSDVLYIGLIIVVFATLWLLVKGVERFER